MPFSSVYQEGVPSGVHSTTQGLLALTTRFFRLVLRKSLEACFKVKAINTCRNEQSSLSSGQSYIRLQPLNTRSTKYY